MNDLEPLPQNPNTAQNPGAPTPPASSQTQPQKEPEVKPLVRTLGPQEKADPENAQSQEFRRPVFLSPSELRKLRARHEDFMRSLAARLSIYLRMEFGFELTDLQAVSYAKFIDDLPSPAYLSLFKAEPLRGVCILNLAPRLGLAIVDRLLGGLGVPGNLDRHLTEIESALLEQVIQIIVSEWCAQWTGDLRPALLGHESNPRFLQTASPETMMLVVSSNGRIGDHTGPVQISFPYHTFASSLRPPPQELSPGAAEPTHDSHLKLKWNPVLDDIMIHVSAQWAGLELTARELSQLKTGDVLQLNPQCLQNVQVHLAAKPKFVGRLGTQGNHWAVELTSAPKASPKPDRL